MYSVYFRTMVTCCGVIECGHFNDTTITKDNFIETLKYYIEENIPYEEMAHNYIAVTNSVNQPKTEAVLKELRFKQTKITGRDGCDLAFWSLFKHPPGIKAFITKLEKEQEE